MKRATIASSTATSAVCILIACFLFNKPLVKCEMDDEAEENQWLAKQAVINGGRNGCLPSVTVIRISTLLTNELGFRAARDMFHSLPRWNDRFMIKIRTYYTKRAAGQSVASTLRMVLQELEKPNHTFVAMLGPDYAAEVQTIALITPIYNLNSIVMSGSAILDDVDTFPLLFRVTPPSTEEQKALISLIATLGIRKVSTIALRELSYMASIQSFADYFTSHLNGTVQSSVVLTNDKDVLDDNSKLLKLTSDSVDYIVSTIGTNMRYAICATYKATSHWIVQPTFLGLDYFDVRDYWRPPKNDSSATFNCSLDELRSAFFGSVFALNINLNYADDRALARPRHDNVTLEQIRRRMRQNSASSAMLKNVSQPSPLAYFSYDGAFALFTALYRVDRKMEEQRFGGGLRLYQLDAKKSSPELWQKFATMLHDELAATSFDGATGRVVFNENQGRSGGIELIQYQGLAVSANGTLTDSFVRVGYLGFDNTMQLDTSLLKFRTNTSEAPHIWRLKYEQPCSKLADMKSSTMTASTIIAIAVASAAIGLMSVLAAVVFVRQHNRLKRARQQQSTEWLLPNSLLQQKLMRTRTFTNGSFKEQSQSTLPRDYTSSLRSTDASAYNDLGLNVAVFHLKTGVRVHLRRVTASVLLTAPPDSWKDNCVELNRVFEPAATMFRLTHENVNQFFGICLDYRLLFSEQEHDLPVSVFEFQTKNSLRLMLQQNNDNCDWTVDSELVFCFIADCVRGMRALHEAGVVHGFLHTGGLVLDTKLTCKITNYGLANFARTRQELEPLRLRDASDERMDEETFRAKIAFRSPEQLRGGFHGCDVKKSDIYATGMVLVEIITGEAPQFCRAGKFELPMTGQQVLESYISSTPRDVAPILRPNDASFHLRSLVMACTSENAIKRPNTMDAVYKRLIQMPEFAQTGSVVERLVQRLQRYGNDLEKVASARTQALFEEAYKSEQLLLQILPASVAAELKAGRQIEPEFFDCVSIYFSDIVDFTATIGMNSTPMQIVQLLNSLHTIFDSVLQKFNVYKVETIGDAYMVASGLPQRNQHKHAEELCRFAMEMAETMRKYNLAITAREATIWRHDQYCKSNAIDRLARQNPLQQRDSGFYRSTLPKQI